MLFYTVTIAAKIIGNHKSKFLQKGTNIQRHAQTIPVVIQQMRFQLLATCDIAPNEVSFISFYSCKTVLCCTVVALYSETHMQEACNAPLQYTTCIFMKSASLDAVKITWANVKFQPHLQSHVVRLPMALSGRKLKHGLWNSVGRFSNGWQICSARPEVEGCGVTTAEACKSTQCKTDWCKQFP